MVVVLLLLLLADIILKIDSYRDRPAVTTPARTTMTHLAVFQPSFKPQIAQGGARQKEVFRNMSQARIILIQLVSKYFNLET